MNHYKDPVTKQPGFHHVTFCSVGLFNTSKPRSIDLSSFVGLIRMIQQGVVMVEIW